METSVSEFYYLIRHPDGEMVGTHKSNKQLGENAMLGAYRLESTNKETIDTLEEFGAVASLYSDSDSEDGSFAYVLPKDIVSKP
jgi:hypothetical protein